MDKHRAELYLNMFTSMMHKPKAKVERCHICGGANCNCGEPKMRFEVTMRFELEAEDFDCANAEMLDKCNNDDFCHMINGTIDYDLVEIKDSDFAKNIDVSKLIEEK